MQRMSLLIVSLSYVNTKFGLVHYSDKFQVDRTLFRGFTKDFNGNVKSDFLVDQ